MTAMIPADRTAYLARRDAAVAAALSQVGTVAPAALANAGRHAIAATKTRQVALRAAGPSGIRKAALEMVIQEELAVRLELDAPIAEEARVAEQARREEQEAARVAAARKAKLSSRVADYIRGKVRRTGLVDPTKRHPGFR